MGQWTNDILKRLDLRSKIAQMISVRAFSHYVASDNPESNRLMDLVSNIGIGGVTFFQGSVPGQALLTNKLQEAAGIPLLIAQDAENGIGMRLPDATVLPHMMAIGASGKTGNAVEAARIVAMEARALGVHQVFGPVADINSNASNPIINIRSFGSDTDHVAKLVTAAVSGLQDHGVIATAKHFPGHGDTSVDTHLDLAVLPFSITHLRRRELVPFVAAIKAGVRSIMVGHLAVPQVDTSGKPASLSENLIGSLLKQELGFEGLVVTDALDMDAIKTTYSAAQAAVLAVQAGVDMLLLVEDEYEAIEAIEKAVQKGNLTEERIDDSVRKILIEKEWSGCRESGRVDMRKVFDTVACRPHLESARQIAADGICRLDTSDSQAPMLKPGEKCLILPVADNPCESFGDVFTSEISSRVEACSAVDTVSPGMISERKQDIFRILADCEVAILPVFLSVRSYSGSISFPDDVLAFIQEVTRRKRSIVVLLGSPYLYGSIADEETACMATCSTSPASEWAAARVIFGDLPCKASLPVVLS